MSGRKFLTATMHQKLMILTNVKAEFIITVRSSYLQVELSPGRTVSSFFSATVAGCG